MDDCIDHGRKGIRGGYTTARIGPRCENKHIGLHVRALIEKTGEQALGRWALHTCDNPRCINGEHLFWGTPKDNTADMVAKGRHRKVSPTLRRLTAEQVIMARLQLAYGASLAAVGRSLSINPSSVQKLRDGKTYKDVGLCPAS